MPADLALIVVLVAVLPCYMMARSLAGRGRPPGDRIARYRHTIVLASVPSLALAVIWVVNRRPVGWLGLDAPGTTGWILLGGAIALIAALMTLAPRAKRPANPKRNEAAAAMMPVTKRETAWFIAVALTVGIGWELLYRGYLWWALQPAFGTPAAVAVMALSYGIAHGYRGPAPLFGSIVSALLFAGGYALTLDLWWLIVIHVGLPLVGLRIGRSAAA